MLRLVVLVSSELVPAWQKWCIDALRALDGRSVEVRVGCAASDPPTAAPPQLLTGVALRPTSVGLDCVEAAGADIVLDFTGDSGVAAASEVWSFLLAGSDDRRLPFAREIAAGAASFEIFLIRRTTAATHALRSGRFPATEWYASTLRLALSQAALWPASLVAALAQGAALATDAAPAAPRRAPLSPFEWFRFWLVLAAGIVRAATSELLAVTEWNVGFARGGPSRLLSDETLDVRWLPQPAQGTFIADPFVVERDGVRALFVETFDIRAGRGCIEALVLDDDDRVVSRARALERPTHLSYPFPVEFDGALYLVPENCADNEIALYRCLRFPDRWERETALFPEYDGVDTTLFSFQGRWWSFGTQRKHGSNVALYAHYAPSPRGPWTAHVLNPIVCDVSSARPAGRPFIVDGVLYRLGQNSTRSYGGGVAIARIDVLSPTSYRETIVRRIDGHASGRWAAGFHTVDFTRGSIVVDGKHTWLDLRKLPYAVPPLVRRLGALVRPAGRR